MSASYIDLHIETDSKGRLRMKLYDKLFHYELPIYM